MFWVLAREVVRRMQPTTLVEAFDLSGFRDEDSSDLRGYTLEGKPELERSESGR